MMDVSTQNSRGQWVPAIPLPMYLSWKRFECDCKRRFKAEEDYRGHYALVHVMGLS